MELSQDIVAFSVTLVRPLPEFEAPVSAFSRIVSSLLLHSFPHEKKKRVMREDGTLREKMLQAAELNGSTAQCSSPSLFYPAILRPSPPAFFFISVAVGLASIPHPQAVSSLRFATPPIPPATPQQHPAQNPPSYLPTSLQWHGLGPASYGGGSG